MEMFFENLRGKVCEIVWEMCENKKSHLQIYIVNGWFSGEPYQTFFEPVCDGAKDDCEVHLIGNKINQAGNRKFY